MKHGGDVGWVQIWAISLFAVFLGATDGIALGSILFPHSADHPNADYKRCGMALGLLTSAVANIVACARSQLPSAVSGVVLPVMPILAAYFQQSLGPEHCATVMLIIPLLTLLCGLLTYLVGLVGVQDVVRACPFVVFGGFIAGTGAQLLQFSLNMMYPPFESFTAGGSSGVAALLSVECWLYCAPGVIVAVGVFLLPRLRPNAEFTFLLPAAVAALAASFYLVLMAFGVSVADARAQGWLFDVAVPKKLDFWQVWSVAGSPVQLLRNPSSAALIRWDKLFSAEFVLVTIQVFLMGLLTTAKNIYGTAEVTGTRLDFDREVRTAGLQGVACGLVGGMPGNLVMSFSVTAHALGAKRRGAFGMLLALNSLLFFVVGDFVIAFAPKMVPACVLFWLGLLLCAYWCWDALGHVSTLEHATVLLMLLIDLIADAGTMLLAGLALTFLLTLRRLTKMRLVTREYTLKEARSDVRRSDAAHALIDARGGEVLVMHLAQCYLSWLNTARLQDRIAARVRDQSAPPLRLLVLEFREVLGIGASGLHTLSELSAAGGEEETFLVLVAGAPASVSAAIRTFTNCVSELDARMLTARAKEFVEGSATKDALMLAADALECSKCGEICDAHVPAEALALEFAEELILATHADGADPVAAASRPGRESGADWAERTTIRLGLSLPGWTHEMGLGGRHPALSLVLSIRQSMRECEEGLEKVAESSLLVIAEAVELAEFAAGEIIYRPSEAATDMLSVAPPPLLWLLCGEVVHTWLRPLHASPHVRALEGIHALQPCVRLEKASLLEFGAHECVCLMTQSAFFGGFSHPAKLRATRPSKCLVLTREAFDQLAAREPKAAALLCAYLARVRFGLQCSATYNGPRLVL